MKLIFITRKLDRGDTRAGFVFDWIDELAGKLEQLYVICQEKGELGKLPSHVEVYSFGKEKGYGKPRQLFNLLFLLFNLGRKSQGIFCHMMPIYAILAWLPAKLSGKKLVLWYTHKSVDLKLKIAATLVDRILTASKDSCRLESGKVKVVGHGIPVGKFKNKKSKLKNTNQKSKFNVLSIGRISRVKDYESLIKAMEILVNEQEIKDIRCEIYGDPALEQDLSYLQSLQEFIKNAGLKDFVYFRGGVAYAQVPELYRRADLFVNLSRTGSLDKTILEAGASGTLLLTSNEAFIKSLSAISPMFVFERDNPKLLADRIAELKGLKSELAEELTEKLRSWVGKEHNLERLADRIIQEFEGK